MTSLKHIKSMIRITDKSTKVKKLKAPAIIK